MFKDGPEEVANDLRGGRTSSSTTEVTIQLVRIAVRGDRRLTIRMIISQLDMRKDRLWKKKKKKKKRGRRALWMHRRRMIG